MPQYNYLSTKKLLYSLFALVFVQNAFVLSVAGGTFKWYELVSILLLFYLAFCAQRVVIDKISVLFLLLFVISPIVSDFYAILMKK